MGLRHKLILVPLLLGVGGGVVVLVAWRSSLAPAAGVTLRRDGGAAESRPTTLQAVRSDIIPQSGGRDVKQADPSSARATTEEGISEVHAAAGGLAGFTHEVVQEDGQTVHLFKQDGTVRARVVMQPVRPSGQQVDAAGRDLALGHLYSPDTESRLKAVGSLGLWAREHGEDDVVAYALSEALRKETDPTVAEDLGWHLAAILREDTFSRYLELADRHSNDEVRSALLVDIPQIIFKDSYRKELELFSASRNPPLEVAGLVANRRQRLRTILVRAAERDPVAAIREGARSLLDRIPPTPAAPSGGR